MNEWDEYKKHERQRFKQFESLRRELEHNESRIEQLANEILSRRKAIESLKQRMEYFEEFDYKALKE